MEETLENGLQANTSAGESGKKNTSAVTDSHFWVGLIGGALLTLSIIGLVLIGKKIYTNYVNQKAIGDVQAAVSSGQDSMVTPELIKKIGLIENVIDKYFLDEYTKEELEEGIYDGIMYALGDKYAGYYSVEELKKLAADNGGYYCGIGAYISYDDEYMLCEIAGTMEGSPAEAAGLQEGDLIYMVDNLEVQGMEQSDVVAMVKGEEGTTVHLSIVREGADEVIEVDIVRAKLDTTSVGYEMMEDNIGYIAITEFDGNTPDQFTEALAVLKGQGARGLIIDLRGNLGGELSAVCDMCRYLLPEGLIVYTMDKSGHKEEYTCDGSREIDIPMVVLVNKYSASAAEIMTGAIKDYGKGTIMGTTTFGKGIVQKVISLSDGSAVKLTTSRYYTPSGVCIQGTGIEPDIEVQFDGDAYYNDGVDNQLDAAVEQIHHLWETAD